MLENKPRQNSKVNFRPPALGGASLLVIFAVLCLTVFALLSLSTVQADCRLANATAQAVDDYYAADWEAQMLFSRLRQGEIPAEVSLERYVVDENNPDNHSSIYAYTCPLSETQELKVRVQINPDNTYSVLRWQAQPSNSWQNDDTLEVWDGLPF